MASRNRAQRIGIWIIAIIMTVGTVGSLLVVILANDNAKIDQARIEQLMQEYQTAYDVYTAKITTQASELSKKYLNEFNKYSSRVKAFNKDRIVNLVKTDLKIGGGKEIKVGESFTAYYIGWNPSGDIFDSSIEGKTLKAPFTVEPGSVIQGWSDGVVGMRIGGVRELVIPSDQAYGETGGGEKIPPNTPIKFVVMIIPTPEVIAEPIVSDELIKYYGQQSA